MSIGKLAGAHLVGNDVVDLDDEEAIGAHLRDRFVQRVLAAEERERLGSDPEPHLRLWSFFAAKEAAYKVAVKKRPETILAHRRFVVAPDFDSVRLDDLRFSLRIVLGEGYVHAIAWGGDAREEGEAPVGDVTPVGGVAKLEGDDPSAEVRRRLCEGVGQELGVEASELSVVRDPMEGRWDGKGPPRIVHPERSLSLDVSLSHHGRFVAWAYIGS